MRLYVVADVPDSTTAAAAAMVVNQRGSVAVKTVVLISPEEIDRASRKAVDYRPPGR
jgi:hypothetical protein